MKIISNKNEAKKENYKLHCGCNLCSGLWPGRGDGLGEPGQLAAAGDIAANGLLSG